MAEVNAIESLTTFRHGREGRGTDAAVTGAILFDPTQSRQAKPQWFDPEHWGASAQPVQAGGRGSAWFVEGPFGAAVLRHYLRGGVVARFSRDRYLWQGEARTRSFAEYRLTDALHRKGLPVPRPIAAMYQRSGTSYRAAILLERLERVQTFAECVDALGSSAPWEDAGRLVARFHAAGLDHADLNATNILFRCNARGEPARGGKAGAGWLIDFDRCRLRRPGTTWRENNLARLLRSLQKLRGARSRAQMEADFARLHDVYELAMERGE